jgi:hypothetical protein
MEAKFKKTLSLTELIIGIALISSVIMMLASMYLFFARQIIINRERYDMLSQINYVFEDMKLRCSSATKVDPTSMFSPSGSSYIDTKTSFKFFGESNIYNVTPDDDSDNVWYTYLIKNGSLVLETETTSGITDEVLIDAKYLKSDYVKNPLQFTWYQGYEPNFFTVTITTVSPYSISTPKLATVPVRLSRTDGVKFWFIDIKK